MDLYICGGVSRGDFMFDGCLEERLFVKDEVKIFYLKVFFIVGL